MDVPNTDNDPFRTTAEYARALEFLNGRINYEQSLKMPYSRKHLGLDRMHRLLELVGDPHRKTPLIHIAGTKGKGSTTAFLTSALAAAGFRCGSYTSPHLHHVEERFRLNGKPSDTETLTRMLETLRPAVEQMDEEREDCVTYFEIATTLGFLFFIDQQVDVAVVEVGLGGRLDSTNVCHPLVSVITSISLDHTKQLGDTLALIAAEKAGIVKPGIPVVSGCSETEPQQVIEDIAKQRGAKLIQCGREFRSTNYRMHPTMLGECDLELSQDSEWSVAMEQVELGPVGKHQAMNAAVAWATLNALPERLRVKEEDIRRGFRGTKAEARIEVIATEPMVIIDAAHNLASIQALVKTLQELPTEGECWLILSTTKGKDLSGMLDELLTQFDHFVCTQYQSNPRGHSVDSLVEAISTKLEAEMLPHKPKTVQACCSPKAAWELVREKAQPRDRICVAGSFFIAAEIRELV